MDVSSLAISNLFISLLNADLSLTLTTPVVLPPPNVRDNWGYVMLRYTKYLSVSLPMSSSIFSSSKPSRPSWIVMNPSPALSLSASFDAIGYASKKIRSDTPIRHVAITIRRNSPTDVPLFFLRFDFVSNNVLFMITTPSLRGSH